MDNTEFFDKEFGMLTIQDYYAQLKAHDWFYYMSDDLQTEKAGMREEAKLQELAETHGGRYYELFHAFLQYARFKVEGVKTEMPKL